MLELFHGRGCCLCDRLEELIEPWLEQLRPLGIQLQKRDIRANQDDFLAYATRIPVLTWNGKVLLEGRPEPDQIAPVMDQLLRDIRDHTGKLVKLYAARDSLEAHFIRSFLEDHGIRSIVQGEALSIGRGELPLTQETLPSIWVNQVDADKALVVLQSALAKPAHTPAPWTCPRCGEAIEGQFAQCWKCGMPHPDVRADDELDES